MDNSQLVDKLENYLDRMQAREPDYDRMRKELAGLLDDVELREVADRGSNGEVIKKTFLDVASQHSGFSKAHVAKLSEVFDQVKGIAQSGGSTPDKAMRAFDSFTPGREEDTQRLREKLGEYLRRSGRQEVSPEALQRDLEVMIHAPGSTPEVLRNRLSQLDRNTLVALVAAHPDIPQQRADQLVHYAEKAIETIMEKFGSTQAAPNSRQDAIRSNGPSANNSPETDASGWKGRFEDKLRHYFDGLQRPELNYTRLQRDFEHILQDPAATFGILKSRLSRMDCDTLLALLSSRENVSKEDAERMMRIIEEARNSVLRKGESVEQVVASRLAQVEAVALSKAEHVRKAAATAAWWLFASAAASEVAAAVGGALAIQPDLILLF